MLKQDGTDPNHAIQRLETSEEHLEDKEYVDRDIASQIESYMEPCMLDKYSYGKKRYMTLA